VNTKSIPEEIVLVVFVITIYGALPAAIIAGWIRWVRWRTPGTRFSSLSLLAFGLATCSGLLALISLIYAHAIGGFPYYDRRLLRFYRWGGILADVGFVLGMLGCWRRNPLRWYAPLCALGMSVFWAAAAMGE
jgi:hypothetical protein